mmetsp:Transcript_19680/g.47677  ORF Transcript_19680/g.47677 Transcript_19680/m.47677 type:complete len:118 (-) Transcript_19680:877-1230(-)
MTTTAPGTARDAAGVTMRASVRMMTLKTTIAIAAAAREAGGRAYGWRMGGMAESSSGGGTHAAAGGGRHGEGAAAEAAIAAGGDSIWDTRCLSVWVCGCLYSCDAWMCNIKKKLKKN